MADILGALVKTAVDAFLATLTDEEKKNWSAAHKLALYNSLFNEVENWHYDGVVKILLKELWAQNGDGLSLKDDAGNLGLFVEDGGNVGVGNNTPSVALDVTGRIEASVNSRVRVTKNDAQTINTGAYTVYQYDDETFDSDGEFSNYTFTAKRPGYFHVSASMMWQEHAWAVGVMAGLSIYKNGAAYSTLLRWEIKTTSIQFLQLSGNDLVYLNGTTDYIDIRVYQNHAATLNTHTNISYNYLNIFRIG